MLSLFFVACGKDDDDGGGGGDLSVSQALIQFSSGKDASLVKVISDKSWKASCDADWMSLSANSGDQSTAFLIGASPNPLFERTAKVIISSGNATQTIEVVQKGVSKIEFQINGVPFTFLPVEADTTFFLQGETYFSSRSVFLSSYFISQTEITNAQWQAVLGSLPYVDESSKPQMPVVVNYNTIANVFLPKINALADYRFRLPTEHEWEVAAMGGMLSKQTSFAGSIYIDEVAWHYLNSEGRKHVVASKKPNELGLYDMSGNVSEWCSDWYVLWTEQAPPPSTLTNPAGPTTGTLKVIKGGDFSAERFEYDRNNCRISSRNFLPPDISTEAFLYDGYNHHTGFRLIIYK
ncbi:formylglycine-generating enzyme required for sulfatase activity [Breznakibacter xylanolyticus]|uniref:Formylglycine-generating enzyme required for sulfatase activity n=2 Tax=Breznakibacter xylanolyticus TaxID=990 RepID=A0A2W7N6B3_9BACT|nr:formylglycine-generating enzyme required for sulfatase activity [Breznakibacter xylanolyticus]